MLSVLQQGSETVSKDTSILIQRISFDLHRYISSSIQSKSDPISLRKSPLFASSGQYRIPFFSSARLHPRHIILETETLAPATGIGTAFSHFARNMFSGKRRSLITCLVYSTHSCSLLKVEKKRLLRTCARVLHSNVLPNHLGHFFRRHGQLLVSYSSTTT